ncbi:transmembrane protein 245 isoform X2 [Toxorhynchites rutilus septentrionalis]|uniref:transmembrane protein 245 isoform X2 n=1 Tax=Toxorhynchites rutilus septentrionalis TaxID=329112 RepID=UPI002478A394|nr:transmembrane protein 245 isoform X2 [Toxorhynchites rutilus septentrionalis]
MSTRPSPAPFKRSFDGLFNAWLVLRSQGHEKPLRNALYNVMMVAVVGVVVGVTLVLAPFFKPLLWAFLFGAVLFPAKKRLAEALNRWIERIEKDERHLLIGIVGAPVHGADSLGEFLTEWLMGHLKMIGIGCGSLISLRLVVWLAPTEVFLTVWHFIVWKHSLFRSLLSSLTLQMLVIIIVLYVLSVYILWTPSLSGPFLIIGQFLWVLIVGYGCSFLGALQVPVFLGILTYGAIGLVYNLRKDERNVRFIDKWHSLLDVTSYRLNDTNVKPLTASVDDTSDSSRIEEIKSKLQLDITTTPPLSSTMNDSKNASDATMNKPSDALESDLYFRILFYACGATIIWMYTWILFLGIIPISLHLTKRVAEILGIIQYATKKSEQYWELLKLWLFPRHSALLPLCLPGILSLNVNIHRYMCAKIRSFIDDISSIVMIGFLSVLVMLISVFAFTQIYSETIAVAQLGSNVVNRTLTHRPELIEMLPIDMQSMDNIIDNAYKYGRSHIEQYVDDIFNDTDPIQAKKLKGQILSVWDRLIQSWMDRNNGDGLVGPRVTGQSIRMTIDEIFINPITKAGIIGFVKSNIGMLLEVGDSLWILLRTNLTLLVSAIGTLVSVILGGGHAVLKFLFHTIIFFTTLYYLLQSSQNRYAPTAITINNSWGPRIIQALEDSISSVVVATLKLALFHGLFTWFTHTIVGAHIVYLPAVLASILAAAPFLETYWCSVPAFLDLWLSQDRFWLGAILVLIHFIVPSNFNPIIHSEIKGGGHPYLTGLSIAGGMYLFGLEGALLGPLLLCVLVVLFEVTMSAIRDSPITPQTRKSSLDTNNEMYSPATTNTYRYGTFSEIADASAGPSAATLTKYPPPLMPQTITGHHRS